MFINTHPYANRKDHSSTNFDTKNHLELASTVSKFVLNPMVALTIHPAPAYTNAANPKKRSSRVEVESSRKELKSASLLPRFQESPFLSCAMRLDTYW